MFVAEGLKPDIDNDGWVMGWAVVRSSPWHLVGVYATKDVAETKAENLGGDYEARYGWAAMTSYHNTKRLSLESPGTAGAFCFHNHYAKV